MRWQRNSPCLPLLAEIGPMPFVQFNDDAHHVTLPKEGHLSTMINGVPSRNTCGHLCQLEVHVNSCAVGGPGGVPWRTKWGLAAGANLSIRITSPWHEVCSMNLPVNLHSTQWTFPRSHRETMHPRPQLPTEPQHQLPLLTSLWNIPLKQIATSAWLPRSNSSHHVLCWTPPCQALWGIPPSKGQHPWSWGFHPLPDQKTLPNW